MTTNKNKTSLQTKTKQKYYFKKNKNIKNKNQKVNLLIQLMKFGETIVKKNLIKNFQSKKVQKMDLMILKTQKTYSKNQNKYKKKRITKQMI